jgi:glycosyltransferase involved in cell wall biosynthesis
LISARRVSPWCALTFARPGPVRQAFPFQLFHAMSGDRPERPYFPGVGVLAFVPDRWEACWQPRHQVLARLARYFHVLWVTPPIWWRERFRNSSRAAEVYDGNGAAIEAGFGVFRPPRWLPEVGRPAFLANWTTGERLRRARGVLQARGCTTTIVYIWRPSFGGFLSLVPHDLSCYHIDDEYSFSEVEKPLDPNERRLISAVDQVFIHSPALLKKKGDLNTNTAFVPNGVDYGAYATPQSEPADLKQIPHPRIGYVGRIKRQLDLALLRSLAGRHAEWSFVLVGPVESLGQAQADMRELSAMPNVHTLGPKPVHKLPAYAQHLDVCMLCYAINDYTKFIYPLKLHEYLASGRPVVGSPIESLREFGGVVRLAHGVDEWSSALSDALNPAASDPGEIERRRRIAREHDWDRLVDVIARTLCRRLGAQYLEQFGRIPSNNRFVLQRDSLAAPTAPEAVRSLSELPAGRL